MKTLLLYSYYTDLLSYFDDWMDAFENHPAFDTECVNVFEIRNKSLRRNVNELILKVDLIVIHHSMNGDTLKYLKPFIPAIKNRDGILVSFVGNELSLPTIGMEEKIKTLIELEADIIATQLLEEAGIWLYNSCKKSKVISLPHGLNPKKFKKTKLLEDRKIDIGTRSAKYGVWLGDNERNEIISYFNTVNHGFILDLGLDPNSKKRFNRNEWSAFLNNCKATLSTEAGSYFLEPGDKIVNQVFQYLKKKSKRVVLPNDTFLYDAFKYILPVNFREFLKPLLARSFVGASNIDEGINFSEIHQKFFADKNRAPVHSKAISSRHFDAIGTHTLNIMYPGRYNDILRPNEDYFELKRDHSNIDDLIKLLENLKKVNEITASTYNKVLNSHTHKNRLDNLLNHLSLLKPLNIPVLQNISNGHPIGRHRLKEFRHRSIEKIKKKGILFIVGSLRTGGTENHISQVASELTQKGWRVEICLLSPYIEVKKEYLDSRIKIYKLPKILHENALYKKFFLFKFFVLVLYSFFVLKILLTKKNHFVHMFLPHAYIIGGFLSSLCRVPRKIMSRRSMNLYQLKSRSVSYFEKYLHSKMDVILGNSQAVVDELFVEGVSKDKLNLIHNGVNLRFFNKKSKKICRDTIGLLDNDFVIVVVANLLPYKGHADLLKAINKIKNRLSSWKLIIVGDDRGEKANLMKIAELDQLKKNIIFMGEIKDITLPLGAADLGVMCSHQEGFSNAILEYMAASLPVVATQVGGNVEAVKDGLNGYTVPPESPDQLAEAILKIYYSADRKKMGQAGRSRIEKVFNLERCVEQYEKVYIEHF